MDDDRQELIARLCAAAGMIMEDVSAIAIMSQEELPHRVAAITTAGRDITAMAAAATALLERER